MIIGLISDIHANLPALEAVLAQLDHADAIVCCGDLIGYYAEPNEVCDLVRSRGMHAIRGNHEAFILGMIPGPEDRDGFYRAAWTRATLRPDNRRWLKSLPVSLEFAWGDVRLQVRHANPWDESTYLNPDSPQLADIRLAAGEILAVGHTHRRMEVAAGDGVVINPGAVGQPRDGAPGASFATLDTTTGQVEWHRTDYPWRSYRDRLAQAGWHPRALALLEG